ncbi:MAG: hypothetical protein COA78_29330 [Blastopirellula sp.]|nr:MAG: hypothetical protein COA78_29330 [Blastopirellula sp.]
MQGEQLIFPATAKQQKVVMTMQSIHDAFPECNLTAVNNNSWCRPVDLVKGKKFVDHFPDYPEGGFIKLPLEIVREVKQDSQLIAGLWTVPAIRRGGKIDLSLKKIANSACLPYRTAQDQLKRLEKKGMVILHGKNAYGNRFMSVSNKAREAYKNNKVEGANGFYAHLQIPREWFHNYADLSFSELVVLAFYQYRCRIKTDRLGYCIDTFEETSNYLGLNVDRIKTITRKLEHLKLINRHEFKGRKVTSIPGRIPSASPDKACKPKKIKPYSWDEESEDWEDELYKRAVAHMRKEQEIKDAPFDHQSFDSIAVHLKHFFYKQWKAAGFRDRGWLNDSELPSVFNELFKLRDCSLEIVQDLITNFMNDWDDWRLEKSIDTFPTPKAMLKLLKMIEAP